MNEDAPERNVTAAAEPESGDAIRWFEESLNAWIAAGEAIGDPWRLQELVLAAQGRASAPGEMARLLVDSIANEALPHVSPPLRDRFREALTAFVHTMQGPPPTQEAAPAVEAPRVEKPQAFESRVSREVAKRLAAQEGARTRVARRAHEEVEQVREAMERTRRRLRLAADAAGSQRSAAEAIAAASEARRAEAVRLREQLEQRSGALERTRTTVDEIRQALAHAVPTDPGTTLAELDELACEIHLARVATSAELARQGGNSAIASVATLMRRLDDQVRGLCANHTEAAGAIDESTHERAIALIDTLLSQIDPSAPVEAAEATAEPSESDAQQLARGAERVATLIEESLGCCDEAVARARKFPARAKPPTGPTPSGSAV